MRSVAALSLLVLVAGCGLLNGMSDGELRSPLADLTSGGDGDDETCDEDDDCLPNEQVCSFFDGQAEGICAPPEGVSAWCVEASSLPSREAHGPILFFGRLSASLSPCVTVTVDYYDPEGDFPTEATALEQRLSTRTDGDLAAADSIGGAAVEEGDGGRGTFTATVCGASAPSTVAVAVTDLEGNASNPACAD